MLARKPHTQPALEQKAAACRAVLDSLPAAVKRERWSLTICMSTSPESTTTVAIPMATSHCDVCSVARDPRGVVIHFGERTPSALDPRITEVELRHRVVLGEGTAGQLHDLLAALLNESTQPAATVR